MLVDNKLVHVDDRYRSTLYMMFMHESDAFELRIEMKFEVFEPHSFSNTVNAQISTYSSFKEVPHFELVSSEKIPKA